MEESKISRVVYASPRLLSYGYPPACDQNVNFVDAEMFLSEVGPLWRRKYAFCATMTQKVVAETLHMVVNKVSDQST